MGYKIGIDLGTTFSAIAYIDKQTRKPAMIKDFQGMSVIPSVLAFLEHGEIVHGREAKELMADGYQDTAAFFKRDLGKTDFEMEFQGITYTPKKLSSILLRKLVEDAAAFLKEPIEEVLITVPAYFTDVQRRETVEAGLEAGLKVHGVLNEPSAAAYAYGLQNQDEKTILVYDLGGGTFDVSVAQISKQEIKIIGTNGMHELGGKDWDMAIFNWIENQYYEEFGENIEDSLELQAEFMIKAENAKKMLTDLKQTKINCSHNGIKTIFQLERSTFEEISAYQLELTKQVIEDLFHNIGYSWQDIDEVILVGGSTKMPMVGNYIAKELGKEPLRGVDPDEAVAIGAAVKINIENKIETQKGSLPSSVSCQTKNFLSAPKLVERVAHSLGMVSINKEGTAYVNDILIPQNTEIPAKKTQVRELDVSKQRENQLEVYMLQGEGRLQDCIICGKYIFHDILYIEGGKTKLAITYSYNDNGMIEVEAMQQETGKMLRMSKENIPKDMSWLYSAPIHSYTNVQNTVIYIAMDLSGSMTSQLAKVISVIKEFINRLQCENIRFSLIGVADETKMFLPPTNNQNELHQNFGKITIGPLGYGNKAEPFEMLRRFIAGRKKVQEYADETSMIILLADGRWSEEAQESAVAYANLCNGLGIQTIGLGFGTADELFLKNISSMKDLSVLSRLEQLTESFSNIAKVVEEDLHLVKRCEINN